MKEYFVADFKNSVGLTGESIFILGRIERRQTKANKPYLDLVLKDATGEVSAKVWSDSMDRVGQVSAGDVVKVEFEVREFNDRAELSLRSLIRTEDYDSADLVYKSDQVDIEELKKELRKRIDSIRDLDLRKLIDAFFEDPDFFQGYIDAPAGQKVHHNYPHGLLHHTLEMLTIMEGVFKLYPDLDRDLVTTGILLHDIGKIEELDTDELGNSERTVEGKLIGHISIGVEMIKARLPDNFPEHLEVKLLHIILSHQGRYEWGSPVIPATREALAIHYADMFSTYMNIAQKVREKGLSNNINPEANDFSEYSKYLGTNIYLGD